ncbi:hypothetical protein PV328_001234 [Microctonus aethiopoides]|uniref:DUF4806 domain-containing protein n=1 Tax=Microctonus aethiopoides TaxID=144406 RepID=A0AA39FX88_9HYME|nr:hypothetical protein PV328_001234 [Microctonus aethiopoides]
MAENDNFVIVEFSDGLSIVPSTWLHEDRNIRWWPGHLKSQLLINGAIINRTRPEERTWISTLRKVGGNEIHVVIPRILKKLWTDSFAELFSYDGKKNKESFKRLETEKLIKKVAHLMCGPTSTDAQIKECASKWLAQAKVRRTRREARFARVNANIAEEDSDN